MDVGISRLEKIAQNVFPLDVLFELSVESSHFKLDKGVASVVRVTRESISNCSFSRLDPFCLLSDSRILPSSGTAVAFRYDDLLYFQAN